jgi:beta-lactamase regulating signal transducer with metallopeptidase domain
MSLLFLDNWFNNAFIQALGWTLFHSLWQGFLLVVLVSLAIVLTKRSSATIRYRIFSSLFFIFLGTTLCTFIIEYSSLRSIPTPSLLTGNEFGDTLTLSTNTHTAAVDLKVPLPGRLAFYFNEYGPWLMLLWFIIFMLKSIRLGINYAQVQRIRNEKPYVLPAIEKRVNELAKLLRIRRKVILRESTSINVPVTIGFLKPLILIPCGLINNLPPDQVEAILLHELAHIRRLDYLVNLLQCLAETVFFFNPAVLWLSSLLREERENCCDDIAITFTKNKSLFIHALVAFQEYHAGHPMAPGLQGNKYPLLKRIQRIVYNNNKKLNHMEKIFLAAGLVVTGIVALAFTTPATHKTNKPDTNVNMAQKPQPAYITIKDSIPEHRDVTGSINSTIDGKKYKVVVINDKPVALYIDDKRVPDNELEAHHQVMEKILVDGRDNFFKARQRDEEAKKMIDLYDGQSRETQKRSEEALLQEKLSREQNREKQLGDLKTDVDFDKKMELFRDEKNANELFNQKKKLELQDKFLDDIKNDKERKALLFKGDRDKTYQLLLLDKLKKDGSDEKEMKLFLDKLNKQEAGRNDGERQFQLQKEQMEFEKMLKMYQDTSKPKKFNEKRKDDGKEMNDKDDDSDAKLREMAEYRAMLQKEREKDRKEMEKEREKFRKEFEEKRKALDKERDQDKKELEEKRREMQKEGEKDRKEMQEEREEKMKAMQKEREKERKIMDKEQDEKRKEMQRKREKDKTEMEEERRKEETEKRRAQEEERKKEDTERKKETRNDNKNADVSKGKQEFNYNDNKSANSSFKSRQEMTYVNTNGKEKFDYKLEAKGLKASQDDNSPKPPNERVAAKRAESAKRRNESDQRRDELIKELKEDGIISKETDDVSIHINEEEMTVNGVKQSDNVFKKYRQKIGKTTTKPAVPKPAAVGPEFNQPVTSVYKQPSNPVKPRIALFKQPASSFLNKPVTPLLKHFPLTRKSPVKEI